MEAEIKDYPKFMKLSDAEYRDDSDKRRNVERWVENIINSSKDISKVILTIEGRNLPDNYKDIVLSVSAVKELVWSAMSLITVTMSPISDALLLSLSTIDDSSTVDV